VSRLAAVENIPPLRVGLGGVGLIIGGLIGCVVEGVLFLRGLFQYGEWHFGQAVGG